MNEPPPLRIDARLLLEGAVSALSVLMLGINNIGLEDAYALGGGLVLLAAITFISRLLGKSGVDEVNKISAKMDQWMARYSVLASSASAAELRRAEDAAVAIGAPPTPPAPTTQ